MGSGNFDLWKEEKYIFWIRNKLLSMASNQIILICIFKNISIGTFKISMVLDSELTVKFVVFLLL